MNSEAPEQWEQGAWRSGFRLLFRLMPEAEFVLALDNDYLTCKHQAKEYARLS